MQVHLLSLLFTHIFHTLMFSSLSPESTSFLHSWNQAAAYEHTIHLAEAVVSLAAHTGGNHLVAGTLVSVCCQHHSYLSLLCDDSESSQTVMASIVTWLLLWAVIGDKCIILISIWYTWDSLGIWHSWLPVVEGRRWTFLIRPQEEQLQYNAMYRIWELQA